jgi:hypothetical protein
MFTLAHLILLTHLIMSVTSMRITTVCSRGSNGFDVDLAHGSIASIIASSLFILFIASIIVAFIKLSWYSSLIILLISLFLPGFLITRENLSFWIQNKPGLDIWAILLGIVFYICAFVFSN